MSISKNFKNKTLESFRASLYSISLTCGIYIATYELHNFGNKGTFIGFSIALLSIFLIEIFINWHVNTGSTNIIVKLEAQIRKESRHIFYLIVLPIALYISFIGFSYNNLSNNIFYLVLSLIFVTFYLFFTNIKVYFDSRLDNDEKMDSILDILKFIIFFTNINTFSYLFINDNQFISVLGSFTISFLIILMILWRVERIHKKTILYSVLSSFIVSVVFFILNHAFDLTPSSITLMLILLFYIILAILHHRIRRTLNPSVILEYVLVLLALSAVIYGVS